MSRSFGQFIIRYKYLIVIAWVIGAIWMATQAPKLSDIAISETSEFLPGTAPSIQAQKAVAKAFPREGDLGSAIVVFSRPGGLTDADNAYAKSFGDWLLSPDAPRIVRDVTSIFNQQGGESLMLSPDRSVMLMSVGFSTRPLRKRIHRCHQNHPVPTPAAAGRPRVWTSMSPAHRQSAATSARRSSRALIARRR